MEPVFDKKYWEAFVRGYTIYDCAIIREKGFGFLLVEEKANRDILPKTRFINMGIDHPMERRFAVVTVGDFTFSTIASDLHPPEYVAVDTHSHVYSATATRKGEERSIDKLLDMKTYRGEVGVVNKLVRAAGHIYALGNYRKIYRRIGLEQWAELRGEGKGVPLPADVENGSSYSMDLGFDDMSAFAEDDLYAVGGKGDVWRFDGTSWHDCAIPTKARLCTVCCAGDGMVYITELNGTVWAGRGDLWKKVAKADTAWGYQPVDAAWFNGRLYLGGQQGVWTLEKSNKQLVPLSEVETDAPSRMTSGRLDVSPDGKFLLTAGPHGACLNDGSGWRRLFSTFDFL